MRKSAPTRCVDRPMSVTPPTVTAVVAAYNAEPWIGETISAILGQTRPADEVVVVDDGSTDATAQILRGLGDAIRVVTRANGGCPAAFNTAFGAARGDYVAMCGADDVWEPDKLERQMAAIAEHPEIDIAFGGALTFGLADWAWPAAPGNGILEHRRLAEELYRDDFICASTVVIRRRLFERLGPFVERFSADDYDYWMRALAARAVFHYEPRTLVRYRRHHDNITKDRLWVHESRCKVHQWHAHVVADKAVVRQVQACDLMILGQLLCDAAREAEALAAFRASLRRRRSARALAWALLLALPGRRSGRLPPRLVAMKRAVAKAPQTVRCPFGSSRER
jgi:glycosyltransferase involved in cell wall biosynthesis